MLYKLFTPYLQNPRKMQQPLGCLCSGVAFPIINILLAVLWHRGCTCGVTAGSLSSFNCSIPTRISITFNSQLSVTERCWGLRSACPPRGERCGGARPAGPVVSHAQPPPGASWCHGGPGCTQEHRALLEGSSMRYCRFSPVVL